MIVQYSHLEIVLCINVPIVIKEWLHSLLTDLSVVVIIKESDITVECSVILPTGKSISVMCLSYLCSSCFQINFLLFIMLTSNMQVVQY